MNKPRFIDVSGNDKPQEPKKTVFTHLYSGTEGWSEASSYEEICQEAKSIKYLGKCDVDGDMFAVYYKIRTIVIYKGIKGDEFN